MKNQDNQTFLGKFSVYNLIVIALMAAVGVAVKPIIVPLVHIVSGPLLMPGGAVAGGLYMMWIVIGICITGKRGTGTLIGLVQSILVMALGFAGGHGVMSIVSYTIPGMAADVIFLFPRKGSYNLLHCMVGCMAANMSGTFISNILFFRLPWAAVAFILAVAAMSGALGGVVSWMLVSNIRKLNLGL